MQCAVTLTLHAESAFPRIAPPATARPSASNMVPSLPAPPTAPQVRAEQEAQKRAGGEAASDDEEGPVLAKPVQVAASQQVGGVGCSSAQGRSST